MKTIEIFEYLDSTIPLNYQEDYDNSGLQIGFHNEQVNNILISLDLTNEVFDEAVDKNCNVIITHHPLLFKPLKRIDDSTYIGALIQKLIVNKISLYAAHTNLDSLCWNALAESLQLQNIDIIFKNNTITEKTVGYGAIGYIPEGMMFKNFIAKYIKSYNNIVIYGKNDKIIKSVAVLNGAGGSKIPVLAEKENIDCIIVGEAGYHNILLALENNINVVELGHYKSEIILLKKLEQYLKNYLQDNNLNKIKIFISNKQKDQMRCYTTYE